MYTLDKETGEFQQKYGNYVKKANANPKTERITYLKSKIH